MENSPKIIKELKSCEIFVFGSNKAGRHGAGAARQAVEWGALYGEGVGLFGRTYAIPTKDKDLRVLPLVDIKYYVDGFIKFAAIHEGLNFLVTKIGCGLSGYSPEDIAPLFKEALNYENILLPKEFSNIL